MRLLQLQFGYSWHDCQSQPNTEQTSPLFKQQIKAFATVDRLVLRTVMHEMGQGIVIDVLFLPFTYTTSLFAVPFKTSFGTW